MNPLTRMKVLPKRLSSLKVYLGCYIAGMVMAVAYVVNALSNSPTDGATTAMRTAAGSVIFGLCCSSAVSNVFRIFFTVRDLHELEVTELHVTAELGDHHGR